jgi:hypothetical protein
MGEKWILIGINWNLCAIKKAVSSAKCYILLINCNKKFAFEYFI